MRSSARARQTRRRDTRVSWLLALLLSLSASVLVGFRFSPDDSASEDPSIIRHGRWILFVAAEALTDRLGRLRDGVLPEDDFQRLRDKLGSQGQDSGGCGAYVTPADEGFSVSDLVGRSREVERVESGLDSDAPWQKRLAAARIAVRGRVVAVVPGVDWVWFLPTNLVTVEVTRVYRNASSLRIEPESRIRFRTESGEVALEGRSLCVKSAGEHVPAVGDELIVRGEPNWNLATPLSLLTRRDVFVIQGGDVRFPPQFEADQRTASIGDFEDALSASRQKH